MRARTFTLMEMVVVIAIIALLAGIATPVYFKHVEKAKVSAAQGQAKSLEGAVLDFQLDVGRPPKELRDLVQNPGNLKKWKGPYLSSYTIPQDPWGNDYHLVIPGTHGVVDIVSYGSDGQPGGDGTAADIGNWTATEP